MKTAQVLPGEMAAIMEIATPKMYPAENIIGCLQFGFDNVTVENPFHNEEKNDPSVPKRIQPHALVEKLIAEGWEISFLGWIRNDGTTNFGHEPSVSHKLAVVMVKLRTETTPTPSN